MSTGIAAAIPLIIAPHENIWKNGFNKSDFSCKFFDNYTSLQDGQAYTIKRDLLINNYKSFLEEFFDCIGDGSDYEQDTIPYARSYDEFMSIFSRNNRNYSFPFIESESHAFSILGGVCKEYWLFYYGSCKAYLETYKTLLHFERTLEKAMKNPLASAAKFGIYG